MSSRHKLILKQKISHPKWVKQQMGSGLQKNQLVFESVIKIGWAEKKVAGEI